MISWEERQLGKSTRDMGQYLWKAFRGPLDAKAELNPHSLRGNSFHLCAHTIVMANSNWVELFERWLSHFSIVGGETFSACWVNYCRLEGQVKDCPRFWLLLGRTFCGRPNVAGRLAYEFVSAKGGDSTKTVPLVCATSWLSCSPWGLSSM